MIFLDLNDSTILLVFLILIILIILMFFALLFFVKLFKVKKLENNKYLKYLIIFIISTVIIIGFLSISYYSTRKGILE
jgi:sterol desaturase/sphingolipid hydroxylase (fatty acid hydroxylase superfamily)